MIVKSVQIEIEQKKPFMVNLHRLQENVGQPVCGLIRPASSKGFAILASQNTFLSVLE